MGEELLDLRINMLEKGQNMSHYLSGKNANNSYDIKSISPMGYKTRVAFMEDYIKRYNLSEINRQAI